MEFIHSYVEHLGGQGLLKAEDKDVFFNDLLYNDQIEGESFEKRAVYCLQRYLEHTDAEELSGNVYENWQSQQETKMSEKLKFVL